MDKPVLEYSTPTSKSFNVVLAISLALIAADIPFLLWEMSSDPPPKLAVIFHILTRSTGLGIVIISLIRIIRIYKSTAFSIYLTHLLLVLINLLLIGWHWDDWIWGLMYWKI